MEKDRQCYRAVVIGCGRIGSLFSEEARLPGVHSHAQAYRVHPRFQLVGVSDSKPDRLAEAGRAWQAETNSDAIALCRRVRPDVVSICTPDSTHYSVARRLLIETPPRVLFMEKPLALKAAEAGQLLELARQQDCAIALNYSRRYSPAFRTLKREVEEGQHGKPLLARILYSKGLLHNGTHAIDLLRFWLGEPVKGVGHPAAWGPEDDETYDVDLWFANGCHARLDAFDERVATIFELDFLTERSRWRFWLGGHEWEFLEVGPSPNYTGYKNYIPTNRERTDARFRQPLSDCLWHAVDNIAAFLDGASSLLCTGVDGLAAIRWAETLRRAQ